MKTPPVPSTEKARLDALHRFKILDTVPEQVFDDLTRLAAFICEAPIALVSLVDADRQWFKSRFGLDAPETPRDISFCGHAVAARELLVIPDATLDPRFTDNPLVVSEPKIRFYAGAPLITPEGHALGTLCVIDSAPRQLRKEQADMLLALSRQVVNQLELRIAKEAAEQGSRAKSAFLANMSHELRTPLNSIFGFTTILLKDKQGTLSSQDRSYLERIHTNGEHLLGLINEILDLSKIEAGRVHLETVPVDVAALVSGAVEQLGCQIEDGKVTVRIDVPNGLQPLVADEQGMRQVLLNLLANAVKFARTGNVNVEVIANPDGTPLRLNVSDDGIGIAADKLASIFESFQQADESTAREYGGTGLGLSISRKLCEQMGFTLDVDSRIAEGATFSVGLVGDPPPFCHVAPGPRA